MLDTRDPLACPSLVIPGLRQTSVDLPVIEAQILGNSSYQRWTKGSNIRKKRHRGAYHTPTPKGCPVGRSEIDH